MPNYKVVLDGKTYRVSYPDNKEGSSNAVPFNTVSADTSSPGIDIPGSLARVGEGIKNNFAGALKESVSSLPAVASVTQPGKYAEAFTQGVGKEMRTQLGVPDAPHEGNIFAQALEILPSDFTRIVKDKTAAKTFAKGAASDITGIATAPLSYALPPVMAKGLEAAGLIKVGETTLGTLFNIPISKIRAAVSGEISKEVLDRYMLAFRTAKIKVKLPETKKNNPGFLDSKVKLLPAPENLGETFSIQPKPVIEPAQFSQKQLPAPDVNFQAPRGPRNIIELVKDYEGKYAPADPKVQLNKPAPTVPPESKQLPAPEVNFIRQNNPRFQKVMVKDFDGNFAEVPASSLKPASPKKIEGTPSRGFVISKRFVRDAEGNLYELDSPLKFKEIPAGQRSKIEQPSKPSVKAPVAPTGEKGSGKNIVERLIKAVKEAKPSRKQQEDIYTLERRGRLKAAVETEAKVGGRKGYYAQLGKLKDPYTKVQYDSIEGQFSQKEIDTLFDAVRLSKLQEFQKIRVRGALDKLFGNKGFNLPTESELDLLDKVFGKELAEAIAGKAPFLQKMGKFAFNALNAPKAISATMDMSAPLRQGAFLIGRFKEFGNSFKAMIPQFFSDEAFKKAQSEIINRPTYSAMQEARLSLTDLGYALTDREEVFANNILEKVPGIKHVVKASERAYVGFLNRLRADVFDSIYKSTSKINPEVAKDAKFISSLGDFINTATGRGSLKGLDQSINALNTAFFSPRLMASRLKLLTPTYYASLHPAVAKEATKSLISFIGIGSTILGLAKLNGMEVGTDPLSSTFGKIKTGKNTYIDIWGGFQQYVVLFSRLIANKTRNVNGKTTFLGEGYGTPNRATITGRFLRNKLAPGPALALTAFSGRDNMGAKTDLTKESIKTITPLIIQNVAEIVKEEGIEYLPLGLLAFFGAGVQDYSGEPRRKELNRNNLIRLRKG